MPGKAAVRIARVTACQRLARIISGGQTGVDRAALDVALELAIPCGGWCPRGRRAEDGAISPRYPLLQTPSRRYGQRTAWNVRDSDATLVLVLGAMRGGTALTVRLARELGRPVLVVCLDEAHAIEQIREFLERFEVRILNVAGPRESHHPGIGERTKALLRTALGAGGS